MLEEERLDWLAAQLRPTLHTVCERATCNRVVPKKVARENDALAVWNCPGIQKCDLGNILRDHDDEDV